ncbi:hypothetical protein GCM10027059_37670 [Myceligenerans halotolerans]
MSVPEGVLQAIGLFPDIVGAGDAERLAAVVAGLSGRQPPLLRRGDLRPQGEVWFATGAYGGGMANEEPEGPRKDAARSTDDWNWGVGIALGVGIGVALGTALGNMAFMAIGIALFPVFAMLLRSRPKSEDEENGSPGA